MKNKLKNNRLCALIVSAIACGTVGSVWFTSAHAAPVSWSVAYDQQVTGGARSLRSLALSADELSLYSGFIQGGSSAGVQHITLSGTPPLGTAQNFYNVTTSQNGPSSADHQPKAVATDARGLVYIGSSKVSTSGDNARIIIQDSTLSLSGGAQKVIALSDIASLGNTGERVGGLSVRSEGANLYLYVSREHPDSAYIERYVIGGTDVATATLTLDAAFNGTGRFNLTSVAPDAKDLRGLEVSADGTMFVTSNGANALFRISSDFASVTRQAVTNPYDVALYDGRAFVTSYNADASAVYELLWGAGLDVLSTFSATAAFPRNNVAGTGYSGIDIDSSGRIYLVDQLYFCTSSSCSSGTWGDRILVSSVLAPLDPGGSVPEPGTGSLALLAVAAAGTSAVRNVRRKSRKTA